MAVTALDPQQRELVELVRGMLADAESGRLVGLNGVAVYLAEEGYDLLPAIAGTYGDGYEMLHRVEQLAALTAACLEDPDDPWVAMLLDDGAEDGE